MPIISTGQIPNLLPNNPNLEQLKKQAKELLEGFRTGDSDAVLLFTHFHPRDIERTAASLSDAQLVLARSYSYPSWPRLVHFIETNDQKDIAPECLRLREAIDGNDLDLIRSIIAEHPEIIHEHVRRSSQRYSNYRPLTYACSRANVEAASIFIELGSDIREDGNLPIARGSSHIPILELLTSHGIDVNEQVYDWGPLISHPCESLEVDVLQWLLDRGADPDLIYPGTRAPITALEMVLGTYDRRPRNLPLVGCVEALIQAGANFEDGPVMDLRRRRFGSLQSRLSEDPDLINRHLDDVAAGATGGRRMTAKGSTLLHMAAEWPDDEAAAMLIKRGADVNARALVNADGIGGQTPLFHALSQFRNVGLEVADLLLEHGADVKVEATVPGWYEDESDFFTGNAIEFAARYPGVWSNDWTAVVTLFVKHGVDISDIKPAKLQ